jgi:hypothetical protein
MDGTTSPQRGVGSVARKSTLAGGHRAAGGRTKVAGRLLAWCLAGRGLGGDDASVTCSVGKMRPRPDGGHRMAAARAPIPRVHRLGVLLVGAIIAAALGGVAPAAASPAAERRSAVDRQVAEILRLNPGSRRISATSVLLEPGVVMTVPTRDGGQLTVSASDTSCARSRAGGTPSRRSGTTRAAARSPTSTTTTCGATAISAASAPATTCKTSPATPPRMAGAGTTRSTGSSSAEQPRPVDGWALPHREWATDGWRSSQ